MNFKTIFIVSALGACVVANAQVVTRVTNPTLTNGFSGSVTPVYNGSNVSTIAVGQSTNTIGSIDGWVFKAAAAPGDYLKTITLTETLSGVVAASKLKYALTVDYLATGNNVIPAEVFYTNGTGVSKYVFGTTSPANSFNALTSTTYTYTFDVSSLGQKNLEFALNQDFKKVGVVGITTTVTQGPVPEPASYATMAFGLAGLLIRRRRSSK
jgi:hypothetical protein